MHRSGTHSEVIHCRLEFTVVAVRAACSTSFEMRCCRHSSLSISNSYWRTMMITMTTSGVLFYAISPILTKTYSGNMAIWTGSL